MPYDHKATTEKAYISDEHRRVLREVDADLRAAVGGAVSTVRVAAGDWTTVESYVERIVSARDALWRAHLAACDPWKEPCGWCGRKPSDNPSSPEERCEACVAEAFAITSASDPHTCALRLPPDSTPAGLRVEIHEGIGSVTTCKVWRDGVLVFDGVDRSVLLSTPPAGGAS